jgi:hypothetical protein
MGGTPLIILLSSGSKNGYQNVKQLKKIKKILTSVDFFLKD